MEERNGRYEAELVYPITGAHFEDLRNDRIILCTHDETGDTQPFVLYGRSAPINGLVTFYAHHISYKLSEVVVKPFRASSVAQAFSLFKTYAMTANPFEFWTDNVTAGTMDVKTPVTVRSIMGGVAGSVLDVFGGEYEWDRFTVRNYAARGRDNGVVIRYGKNLTDLTHNVDRMLPYNAVVPYWASQDGTCVYGSVVYGASGISEAAYWTDENGARMTDENGEGLEFPYTRNSVSVLDLSSKYQEQPTAAQLEADAAEYLANNKPWLPSENLTVDFVALWQTEEYKNIAPLERVRLCDTVTVIYEALGVEMAAKVIRTTWNVLTDRYDEIELGQARSTFAQAVTQPVKAQIAELPTVSMMQAAIDAATAVLLGSTGGHKVDILDENGKPAATAWMDTDDVNTATKVLLVNKDGIGFSTSGIGGPYRTAWTIAGGFNADFITTGTLSANRIKGGILELGGYQNGNGVLHVLDSAGNIIGKWDNTGADITGNLALLLKYSKQIYDGGYVTVNRTLSTKLSQLKYRVAGGTPATGYGMQIKETDEDGNEAVFDVVPNKGERTGPVMQLYTSDAYKPRFYMGYGGEAVWRPSGGIIVGFDDDTDDVRLTHLTTIYENLTSRETYLTFGRDGITVERRQDVELPVNRYPRFWATSDSMGYERSQVCHFYAQRDRMQYSGSDSQGALCSFAVSTGGGYINGNRIATEGVSSKRYKHDIAPISDDTLAPDRLLRLPVVQYVYNDDAPLAYRDMGGQTLPGFVAEDVAEVYPAATVRNADGQVESWDERRIIPGMLALIQKQQKQIDDLEARVAALEAKHADT